MKIKFGEISNILFYTTDFIAKNKRTSEGTGKGKFGDDFERHKFDLSHAGKVATLYSAL